MRVLLKVSMPHEPFNAAVRDGSAENKMQRILETLRPEAVYFTEIGGRRTGLVFLDLAQASDIPKVAEPWFLTFGADVEIHPVMTPEDLGQAGLASLGREWA